MCIRDSDPTPRLLCRVEAAHGNSFDFNALPDTGATVTVLSMDLAKRNGLTIRAAPNERLLSADETGLNVSGYTRFTIAGVPIKALVSTSISNELLLGWRDLIRLNVIPDSFPHCSASQIAQVQAVSQEDIQAKTDALIAEFDDVILDYMPKEPMKGPPMTIELRDDVPIKPRCATTCKPTPVHLQEDADALIAKLLAEDIIEPVPLDEISDWISPAFFVPKDGGKGVRLVTDFTQLNRYVKRSVHPFPTAAEIAKGIAPNAKFFAKLDAVQGYHQVPLDVNSRKLTTFLLPKGKYRYKRGPMGLKSTGDCWCQRSDVAINGVCGCAKIIDDILVTGTTIDELFKSLRDVLTRCRTIGLSIAKKKLKISTSLTFAGYVVSDNGIQPDPNKVVAIKDFPTPTDVTSVRSSLDWPSN